MRTRPAETRSSRITIAFVALLDAFARLGCSMVTASSSMPARTIQSAAGRVRRYVVARAGVVELVDTPALGAGARESLGVRVPPPAWELSAWTGRAGRSTTPR